MADFLFPMDDSEDEEQECSDDFDLIPIGNVESNFPDCCGFDFFSQNLRDAKGSEPMVFALLLVNRLAHSRSKLWVGGAALKGIKITKVNKMMDGLISKELSVWGQDSRKRALEQLDEWTMLKTSKVYLSIKYGADTTGKEVEATLIKDKVFTIIQKAITKLLAEFNCPLSVTWTEDPSNDLLGGNATRHQGGLITSDVIGGFTIQIKFNNTEL